ncbi:MAG: SDR family NAD(P)-dependent oxidoreductase [Desulfobacteraceae bacterium]|nr:SDR family NAD(P)-dependent oxidoreductase [Desulfobacteraceae bacterium]
MGDRLKDKVAIVIGAGQTPGDTIGNGRAISVLFARQGARLFLVDRRLDSARQTQEIIAGDGGEALAFEADITRETDCKAVADACKKQFSRIDILVNNVGIGTGDGSPTRLGEEAWDNIFNTNLKGAFLTCKHVLPIMVEQEKGVILNISSIAAVCSAPILAYKASKAGLNALTHTIAMSYAKKGVRANAIMPGLMNTPMAIESIAKAAGVAKEELIKQRNAVVPLKGGMGDAWDTAYAALFLASDEAKFITGVALAVDGGQSARIG